MIILTLWMPSATYSVNILFFGWAPISTPLQFVMNFWKYTRACEIICWAANLIPPSRILLHHLIIIHFFLPYVFLLISTPDTMRCTKTWITKEMMPMTEVVSLLNYVFLKPWLRLYCEIVTLSHASSKDVAISSYKLRLQGGNFIYLVFV